MAKDATTVRQFKLFKKECDYWIKELGLQGWQVHYSHKDDENKELRAWISFNKLADRQATISLSKDWNPEDPTDKIIQKCAFHEVLELLFRRFTVLAEYRCTTFDEIEEEKHNIIRTLENAVFDKLR